MKEKRQHILQCTHKLFMEKGYLETSLQDILEASDVSKGTFYNYFISKSDLTLELLQGLDAKLSTDFTVMFYEKGSNDEIDNVKKILCYIKTFERDNSIRRILTESVVDKDPVLMKYIQQRRQKSLIWLYQCMETVFGTQYPNAITDATLFLQSLITNLTKYSITGEKALPLETITNSCFDRLLLCIADMNEHPIFHKDIIFKSSIIENNEQFLGATLHLKKWLKTHFESEPKFELFMNYVDFILIHYQELERFTGLKNQIIYDLEQELLELYPELQVYTQYLKYK